MVYRGKPSAGCGNCRKAKKRCDLELPACSRCVKLNKPCSGYRDTSQLQIQDESESVKLKANRAKDRVTTIPSRPSISSASTTPTPPPPGGRPLPSDGVVDLTAKNGLSFVLFNFVKPRDDEDESSDSTVATLPSGIKLSIDDVATSYFFSQFTAPNGHWTVIRHRAEARQLEPVLDLGLRACGMAALNNVKGGNEGLVRSRMLYAQALGLLNAALRDPYHCKTDQSLMAVTLLGFYENLTCDSRQSIMSWKAHTSGATQLLKLRGRAQFDTLTGRMLFRETRAQILVKSIWDQASPPSFLQDWDKDLLKNSPEYTIALPADRLAVICVEFANLKYKLRSHTISNEDAIAEVIRLEMIMVEWSIDTMNGGGAWWYEDVEVIDSPHVWNGVVHGYQSLPSIPSMWNLYRSIRIMLSRTQEEIVRRFELPTEQFDEQMAYLRSVRRQMADDICRSIPPQLGHGAPANISPCVLLSASGSIWPLFFAGTCTLERIDMRAWAGVTYGAALSPVHASSAAIAQTLWIIGRMEYISNHIGLRWAQGIAATLKGDLHITEDYQPENLENVFWDTLIKSKPALRDKLIIGKTAFGSVSMQSPTAAPIRLAGERHRAYFGS